jgi:hypothetical protein
MNYAMGISPHTGWAVCVIVGGSLRKPQIIARDRIEMVGDSERFCFHLAADMQFEASVKWIAQLKKRAVMNARQALAHLLAQHVSVCALIAKEGVIGDLRQVLASHPRIHTAEGFFYRDVLLEACRIPTRIISAKALDPSQVGNCATAPWGRDQKMAALAAWSAINT